MTHYDVLGVGRGADTDALHQAYLRLARQHHPDRNGGDAGRMQAINEAWATLGDPVRRARYDRSLRVRAATTTSPAPRPSPVRPGYEPDPAYDPTEVDDDLRSDLADDRPVRPQVVLPRWLRLVPVATFVASLALLVAGAVFASEPILALAFMTFLLASLFFLAAPFMALLVAHRSARPSSDG